MQKRRFLTARWTNLIMLNYEVDPLVLQPHLPPGTELDLWEGKALVSMVGFLFEQTRVLGVAWPFHTDFEEVNLRFYVRYHNGTEWKRGAVFISEIVPRPIIAIIANTLYKEHYQALPMRHSISKIDDDHTHFQYNWKVNGGWNKIAAVVQNQRSSIESGSAEEFIFEHYWGYNKVSSHKTMEYQVEHVPWKIGKVIRHALNADITTLYGAAFKPFLSREPVSAFFADGSDIAVRMGDKIVMPPVLSF